MKGNRFKADLAAGRRCPGLWLSLCSPTVTEIAAHSGADWILLDMEHAPNDLSMMADQLRAARGGCAEPVVRPPFSDQVITKRLLDIGARTLMFPMIQTAEMAAEAVSWTRYPPKGVRGHSGTIRANGYGRQADYLETYENELCVIVQVETPEAIDQIPAIAAVEGIDAIFIGPGDLASSMGHVGNVGHEDVQAQILRAVTAVHTAGKPVGILGYGEAAARRYHAEGIEFVAVAGDAWLLAQSMDQMLRAVQNEDQQTRD
ncbi:HpcH/HpaI aldolase/citrate lyase family protein [Puniceibacterium sp. IMCC21224]|uniref:HpcH/HpaI aldolase family protein n=1 Tax=Puniceibacterium sp. IMCC21224 TaxID=1618204 RepID=UPI00064D9619|nr:HpcH/HpaI aldolase/citrate lyase family protein [Puniceibacterium sp. IMCC21224]KMK68965.1 2,4-dihydroxyhept-2-ene-1,7-dioic acid aldolase [Puniceibacterium sp. IMCC21224]